MKKIDKDFTDEDIDSLFNNDDTSVLKQNEIVPNELSTETDEKPTHVDRPKEYIVSEETRVKREIEEHHQKQSNKLKEIIDYIKNYRKNLIIKETINKSIIGGYTKVNIEPSTQCTFHIYQPRDIMGDKIYCSCKFCSAMKEFTQSEWDEYCIKYRKWF